MRRYSLVFILVVVAVCGCCKSGNDAQFEESIQGQWLTTDHDSLWYTFNADLSGEYINLSGPRTFTWEIKCEELKICTDGSGSTDPDCGGTQLFDVISISETEMRLEEHTGFPARQERESRFFVKQ